MQLLKNIFLVGLVSGLVVGPVLSAVVVELGRIVGLGYGKVPTTAMELWSLFGMFLIITIPFAILIGWLLVFIFSYVFFIIPGQRASLRGLLFSTSVSAVVGGVLFLSGVYSDREYSSLLLFIPLILYGPIIGVLWERRLKKRRK